MSISDSSTNENQSDSAPLEEDAELYDVQFGISHSGVAASNSGKLYCFSCHRQESHFFALKGRSHYYLMIGMTMGLILLFGPYRCRCCGHKRLCRYNFLNIRYHWHRRKYTRSPSTIASSRSSSSRRSSSRRDTKKFAKVESAPENDVAAQSKTSGKRKKKRRRKLKTVPLIETIGKERREKQENEIAEQYLHSEMSFTMDGLLSSFETEQSLKAKAAELRIDEERPEFVGKKAKPRKKVKGKPKRRHAKKTRLEGPDLYCFSCKQNNEHFHSLKTSGFYSFYIGITLGLVSMFGPYRCSICSKRRLFGVNMLHPKFYFRHWIERVGEGYK